MPGGDAEADRSAIILQVQTEPGQAERLQEADLASSRRRIAHGHRLVAGGQVGERDLVAGGVIRGAYASARCIDAVQNRRQTIRVRPLDRCAIDREVTRCVQAACLPAASTAFSIGARAIAGLTLHGSEGLVIGYLPGG